MENIDDYLVNARTLSELITVASGIRKFAGIAPTEPLDVVKLAELTLPEYLPHFAVVVRADEDMPDALAKASYSPSVCIQIRESVYRQASAKDPVSEFVLLHELSHIFLHERILPKYFKSGNRIKKSVPNMSAETQADDLTTVLLIPPIQNQKDFHRGPQNIIERYNVTYKTALHALKLYKVSYSKLQPHQVQNLEALYPRAFPK